MDDKTWYQVQGTVLTLQIKVFPRSPRACVGPVDAGRLQVRVRAVAEDGKANDAVVSALAQAFEVPRDAVRILSGHAARAKVVRVEGFRVDPVQFEKEGRDVKVR